MSVIYLFDASSLQCSVGTGAYDKSSITRRKYITTNSLRRWRRGTITPAVGAASVGLRCSSAQRTRQHKGSKLECWDDKQMKNNTTRTKCIANRAPILARKYQHLTATKQHTRRHFTSATSHQTTKHKTDSIKNRKRRSRWSCRGMRHSAQKAGTPLTRHSNRPAYKKQNKNKTQNKTKTTTKNTGASRGLARMG